MLEKTNIWTTGPMDLFVDNKPAHVYIPESNVKSTYENLQSRLSQQGSIPIGIDHLADNILIQNPILKKLDLLNVGEITKIEYANDTIQIVEAELTNPLIKDLYEKGELDMVSIVANSTTSECPQDYDYLIDTTDITRVDIVERGACPTCNIPKPQTSDSTVVYARYSIELKEDELMAEEAITKEEIQETVATVVGEAIKPLKEQIDKIDKRLKAIENPSAGETPADEEDSEEIKAMKAEIAELKAQKAEQIVDNFIAKGVILPAKKDINVEICAKDSEAFMEMYKDVPAIVELDTQMSLHAGDSGQGNDLEPDEDDKLLAEIESAFNKGE